MNVWHALGIIGVTALVTWLLRAFPFVFGRWIRRHEVIRDLSKLLPLGVMTILVVYTLRDTLVGGWLWLPAALGLIATLGLHWWKSNMLLSLVGGIVVYTLTLAATGGLHLGETSVDPVADVAEAVWSDSSRD